MNLHLMNLHLMILLLSINVTHKDEPLIEAPQVVCPLSMDEYVSQYASWARKEIRNNNRRTHAR